jgi:hypothetical protein
VSQTSTTGCPENAIVALLYTGGGTLELDVCQNGQFTPIASPSSFKGSWDGRNQAVLIQVNLGDLGLKVKPSTSYHMQFVFWTYYTPDNFVHIYTDRAPDDTSQAFGYNLLFARKKINAIFMKPASTVNNVNNYPGGLRITGVPAGVNAAISRGGRTTVVAASGSGVVATGYSRLPKNTTLHVVLSKTGYFTCAVTARILVKPPWFSLSHGKTCGSVRIG